MPTASRLSLESAAKHPDFRDVTDLPGVRVDLRYGTTNNLLGKNVYDGFQRVLLHKIAAEKFQRATEILRSRRKGIDFLVFDALRPQTAQKEFWELVRGTPQQPYFADPAKGSIHSFGFAIDLSLWENGKELPMGTEFDDLSPLAEPKREQEFLQAGKLNEKQIENRKFLREILTEAGFLAIPHEWWHFDALAPAEVRAKFRIVE